MLEVEDAVSWGCQTPYGSNASCVTSLVGQGTLAGDSMAWGFQAGFYAFMLAAPFLLIAVILRPIKTPVKNQNRVETPSVARDP